VKNGVLIFAVIDPLNPALHVQPDGTSTPLDPEGHFTGSQDIAFFVPSYPALQMQAQPLGMVENLVWEKHWSSPISIVPLYPSL
jgi:hypothetical protein